MRKCMMNAISLGCIAVGSFLLGGSFGLWLGKDESDIFDENCIKMDDLDQYSHHLTPEASGKVVKALQEKDSLESYDRMVRDIYGPKDQISMTDQAVLYGVNEEIVEEDEGWESTTKEITVGEETIQVKQTSEGVEEVGEPYIISEDEYFDPHLYPEFIQENLIYYAKDDVLTTERDEVIYDVDDVVGPNALTSFGSLTTDRDTVFVRNIQLGTEYEVTRDDGSYQEIVLGYSDEDDDRAYKKAKEFFDKMEE